MTPVFQQGLDGDPITIDFYLGDRFTIVPFINALDPLRMANKISGKTLFQWQLLSDGGRPVEAINGMIFPVDSSIKKVVKSSNVILFIGFDPFMELPRELANWLRRLAVQGTHLGAVGAGTLFLAQAGLLDGYKATIHWNYRESFAELFPKVQMSLNIFEIDRHRFSCAGGTATMTMMLYAIANHFGRGLANEVADLFITGEVSIGDHEKVELRRSRIGIARSPLNAVIDEMENHIERPLSITELAQIAGVSQRQIARLFQNQFQKTPVQYYVQIRMEFGRRLIQQTDMQATEIAIASGFGSPEHFFRTYKKLFGCSPMEDRRRNRLHYNMGVTGC